MRVVRLRRAAMKLKKRLLVIDLFFIDEANYRIGRYNFPLIHTFLIGFKPVFRFAIDRQNKHKTQSLLMKRFNIGKMLMMVVGLFMSTISVSYGQEASFRRIGDEDVPTSTQIKFYDVFKGAENVSWFAAGDEGAAQYRADYSYKGKSISLTFDNQNNVLKEVRSSKKYPAPVSVAEFFEANYKGFRLVKLSKVSMMDPSGEQLPQVYYELDVKKGDREILFRFEEDHEMFRGINLDLGIFVSN